jgi:toxin HigB-1
MIRTIRGSATRQFIETGKSKFSGMDMKLAAFRVVTLAQAMSLSDFGELNSVGLHKLKGDRKDFWSVRINGPWRLVFRFDGGDAFDVEIVDYH